MSTEENSKEVEGKPSHVERMLRKRNAARIRQQRCRARKRAAQLALKQQWADGKKEGKPEEAAAMTAASQPARLRPPAPQFPPRYHSFCNPELWKVKRPYPPNYPISNAVSFESQSHEEGQNSALMASPKNQSRKHPVHVVTPTKKAKGAGVASGNQDARDDEGSMSNEECAIAAMLSLKSSDSKPSTARLQPRKPLKMSVHEGIPRHDRRAFHMHMRMHEGFHPRHMHGYNRGLPPHIHQPMLGHFHKFDHHHNHLHRGHRGYSYP